MNEQEHRRGHRSPRVEAGSSPDMTIEAPVRSALRRRGRPGLDQRIVIDGFTLRLLVRQHALRRDGVVLFPPLQTSIRVFPFLLSFGFRKPLARPISSRRSITESPALRPADPSRRRLRRLRTGRRLADVLPPQLGKFSIIRHVVAGWGSIAPAPASGRTRSTPPSFGARSVRDLSQMSDSRIKVNSSTWLFFKETVLETMNCR